VHAEIYAPARERRLDDWLLLSLCNVNWELLTSSRTLLLAPGNDCVDPARSDDLEIIFAC